MSTRKVAPPDPSAQWLLNQFSESAKTNQTLIKGLNQTRKHATNPETRSHQNARLRQALMLITGGACDASLFVDTQTGKLLSASRINIMLNDLVRSHRMDHGKYSAFFKTVFRTMETLMQKSTSVYHASVAVTAILIVLFTFKKTHDGLDFIEKNVKSLKLDKATKTKLTLLGTTLGTTVLPELTPTSKPFNALRVIWFSVQQSITSWRSAQLVNAVFKDGISASKRDKMKKMSRELEQLDQEIQMLELNGHSTHPVLMQKLKRFHTQTRSFWSFLSFGTLKNRNHKVYLLFKDALEHPHKYTRAPFLKELIRINGAHNVLAYHILNSYGDRRNSVEEIIAAYLIMHEKSVHSESVLKEKLIPNIANKTSIQQAKRKQQNTRKSSPRKIFNHTKKQQPKDIIRQHIQKNKVVMFSKTYCPYCQKAKQLLKQNYPQHSIHIIELDTMQNGDRLQDALYTQTKQRTVPNIFIQQKHIGGYDDLQTFL